MIEKQDTTGHQFWIEDEILMIYIKPVPPSLEGLEEIHIALSKLDKKYPVLIDPRDGIAINKEQRAYSSKMCVDFSTAVVMLNNNLFTPLIFRLAMTLSSPLCPLRMYKDVEKAKLWLNNFPAILKEVAPVKNQG